MNNLPVPAGLPMQQTPQPAQPPAGVPTQQAPQTVVPAQPVQPAFELDLTMPYPEMLDD